MREPEAAAREVVLVTPSVPEWATSVLADGFELRAVGAAAALTRDAEVLLTPGPEPVANATIDALPGLRYVCCLGSGYEGLDVAHLRARGITVSNSAIVTAEDVADQALALVLARHADIVTLDRAIREGRWHKPMRRSLRELSVGIVGLGLIGQAIVRRLEPFGCAIRWHGPRDKPAAHPYCADLGELARWADILIVAARADRSNARLIDARILDLLGPAGMLANVSRGSIVDEDALIAALRDGRLGGAALDVFATEPTPAERWRDVPNVVLAPHVGGYATGVRNGIRALIRENIAAWFARGALKGVLTSAPA